MSEYKQCFGHYAQLFAVGRNCVSCDQTPACIDLTARGNVGAHLGAMREAKRVVNAEPPLDYQSKPVTSALDVQEGGDHYKKLGQYQPWEVLSRWMTPEELKGAMKKEVISYLARESDKGGRLDIKKAMHTLQIYLELTERAK